MRLGDMLVREGVLTMSHLDEALLHQQKSTMRLGSVLYLLQLADPDVIARALAKQHGVPAALMKHISARDPKMVAKLTRDVAWRYFALPIAVSRGGTPSVVVCFRDPKNISAMQHMSALLNMPVISAVACEAVIIQALTESYGKQPDNSGGLEIDFAPEPAPAKKPEPEPIDHEFQLVDLDAQGVVRDHDALSGPLNSRESSGILSIGPAGAVAPAGPSNTAPPVYRAPSSPSIAPPIAAPVGAPPIYRAPTSPGFAPPPERAPTMPPIPQMPSADMAAAMAAGTQRILTMPPMQAAAAPPAIAPLDAAGATVALATAPTRDEVGDAMLRYLVGNFAAGVMFVIRDGLALGHRGHGGSLSANVVESLVVPLNVPSVFKDAFERMQPYRGVPAAPSPTQDRFLRVVGYAGAPVEVLLVPVMVRGRVVGLIYAHEPLSPAGAYWADLQALAGACGAAYLRIIIASKQK